MNSERIIILFGGDTSPGDGFAYERIASSSNIWGDSLAKKICDSDFTIINLECPLTVSEDKRGKVGVHLKSSPSFARILRDSGIKLVSLANNHMFDYGVQGAMDTIAALESHEVQWGGAGKSPSAASGLKVMRIKDKKIGFLFWAEHEFNYKDESSWSTGLLNPSSNVLQIIAAKKECDRLLVFTHIGPEYWAYPSPRMVNLFHDFVEAGADAVINCHAHHVMGMEYYKKSPIFYGLGNLLFPIKSEAPGHWYQGILAKLEISEDGIDASTIFTEFKSNGIVEISSDLDAREKEFKAISAAIRTPDEINVKWAEFCREQRSHLFVQVLKGLAAMLPFFIWKKLYHKAVFPGKMSYFAKGSRMFRGLLMCENHIEVMGRIFDDLRYGK